MGRFPVELGGWLDRRPGQPVQVCDSDGDTVGPGRISCSGGGQREWPEMHLGFALEQAGEGVYLFAAGVHLWIQLSSGAVADLSIGRRQDGVWGLTQPTFAARTCPGGGRSRPAEAQRVARRGQRVLSG